jgi:hypothetical protein
MTVTVYVTEISGIFCEIYYTLSIKKDFIPILDFYFKSGKGPRSTGLPKNDEGNAAANVISGF